MRNRALIARWCYEKGKEDHVAELYTDNGKTYLRITDYEALRRLFAQLLAEIQRVKSEGDLEAARLLVETYAVDVDEKLHKEVLDRYARLDLAPYKGFVNPKLTPVTDDKGDVMDILVDYSEGYDQQMMRYGKEYGAL